LRVGGQTDADRVVLGTTEVAGGVTPHQRREDHLAAQDAQRGRRDTRRLEERGHESGVLSESRTPTSQDRRAPQYGRGTFAASLSGSVSSCGPPPPLPASLLPDGRPLAFRCGL